MDTVKPLNADNHREARQFKESHLGTAAVAAVEGDCSAVRQKPLNRRRAIDQTRHVAAAICPLSFNIRCMPPQDKLPGRFIDAHEKLDVVHFGVIASSCGYDLVQCYVYHLLANDYLRNWLINSKTIVLHRIALIQKNIRSSKDYSGYRCASLSFPLSIFTFLLIFIPLLTCLSLFSCLSHVCLHMSFFTRLSLSLSLSLHMSVFVVVGVCVVVGVVVRVVVWCWAVCCVLVC